MVFEKFLKILIEKGLFSLRGPPPRFRPTAEAGPACSSEPPAPAPRASPWPSPAQRRAWPTSTLAHPLTRRAASRPWQSKPAAWRPCAVDAAARHSRPAPAPTRSPTSAEVGALACSLPRCLSSPQAPSSPTLPLAAPPHPPAKFTTPSPPRPAIACQQFCLALWHVVLALVPTVELR